MLNKQPAGDLWRLQDTDAESQYYGKTFHFDFSYIHSEEMKSVVKDYVWQNWKTGSNTLSKLQKDVFRFHHFADFAAQHNAHFILRGVRSTLDFEYERNIAEANKQLSGIETVLLYTRPEYAHISSTLVRDLHSHGKDISQYLP